MSYKNFIEFGNYLRPAWLIAAISFSGLSFFFGLSGTESVSYAAIVTVLVVTLFLVGPLALRAVRTRQSGNLDANFTEVHLSADFEVLSSSRFAFTRKTELECRTKSSRAHHFSFMWTGSEVTVVRNSPDVTVSMIRGYQNWTYVTVAFKSPATYRKRVHYEVEFLCEDERGTFDGAYSAKVREPLRYSHSSALIVPRWFAGKEYMRRSFKSRNYPNDAADDRKGLFNLDDSGQKCRVILSDKGKKAAFDYELIDFRNVFETYRTEAAEMHLD